MACPTCEHTVQRIDGNVWWCPRCGTSLTVHNPDYQDAGVPKLVERVRRWITEAAKDARDGVEGAAAFMEYAAHAGLTEAVFKPEDRP